MYTSPAFFRFTAVCAILTALTTLGVHLLPGFLPAAVSFEERAQLGAHPMYRMHVSIVVLHTLLVVFSMTGFALRKCDASPGWMMLGWFGFLVFGVFELARSVGVLFIVNGWRARFLAAADAGTESMLRGLLGAWAEVNDMLFVLLILGFALGNFFYGLGTWRSSGMEKAISVLLLLWSVRSCVALLDEYAGLSWLAVFPGWFSWTYQPAVRLLIGIWLWQTPALKSRPVPVG